MANKIKITGDINSYYETIMTILENQYPLQYYRCGTCGGPVAYDLCCAWCGETDPVTIVDHDDEPQEKTCLTCEFEPEWKQEKSPWDKDKLNAPIGKCKYDKRVPSCMSNKKSIIFQQTPHKNCPAWRPKA